MSTQYWNERTINHGHTGWGNKKIYYYDQNLRLRTVSELIQSHCHNYQNALDHGCGAGDFTELLSRSFGKVVGVDISDKVIEKAIATNAKQNIEYKVSDSSIFNDSYDLILSITVLQCITDDAEFLETIQQFNDSLRPGGIVVLLDSYGHNEFNGYTKLRDFAFVMSCFESKGFRVKESFNFYHPQTTPTTLFTRYQQSFWIKVLSRLSTSFPLLENSLQSVARSISNRDNGKIERDSVSKFLILEKPL